ncbi:TPA: hypothetical protein NJ588_004732 [Vibrio parahaemolyticus]|nr:hypothetical protein [Vibrio parahaemolyticus]
MKFGGNALLPLNAALCALLKLKANSLNLSSLLIKQRLMYYKLPNFIFGLLILLWAFGMLLPDFDGEEPYRTGSMWINAGLLYMEKSIVFYPLYFSLGWWFSSYYQKKRESRFKVLAAALIPLASAFPWNLLFVSTTLVLFKFGN